MRGRVGAGVRAIARVRLRARARVRARVRVRVRVRVTMSSMRTTQSWSTGRSQAWMCALMRSSVDGMHSVVHSDAIARLADSKPPSGGQRHQHSAVRAMVTTTMR